MSRRTTMKAARFYGVNEPLRLEKVPVPTVGRRDVLVRVMATGICGSDLHILYDGTLATGKRPIILGHEPSGIIADVGSDVGEFSEGDRVIVCALVNCGLCRWCLDGRSTLCPDTLILGIDSDGAMAEYMVAPADRVLQLPPMIPFDQGAVLTDAVATPYHAIVKRGRLKQGESVAVIGCGGLGYHAVLLAGIMGAARIIAVDTDETALNRAQRAGATDLVHASGDRLAARIREAARGGVDLAVECVGRPETIALGTKILCPGGRLVVSGVGPENITASPAQLFVLKEYSLIGSFGYDLDDIADLVALAERGVLDLSGSVSKTVPLEEVNDALHQLHTREGTLLRVVVTP